MTTHTCGGAIQKGDVNNCLACLEEKIFKYEYAAREAARETSLTIRQRIRVDMVKTLSAAGVVLTDDVLENLIEDAMHHVEKYLLKIEEAKEALG